MGRVVKAQDGRSYNSLEELLLASREHNLPVDLRELEDGRIVSSSWDPDSGEEPTVFAQFSHGPDTPAKRKLNPHANTRSIDLADGSGVSIVRDHPDGTSVVIAVATRDELTSWTSTFMAWIEGGQDGPMPELPGLLPPSPSDKQ